MDELNSISDIASIFFCICIVYEPYYPWASLYSKKRFFYNTITFIHLFIKGSNILQENAFPFLRQSFETKMI